MRTHNYAITLTWTGNQGTGTDTYRSYGRDHLVSGSGKSDILGSADPSFRGDAARWNPEELLVASVAACHKLWYLHLCMDAGVVVTEYVDNATAEMVEHSNGNGEISQVMLNPEVTITAESDAEVAMEVHHQVGEMCFIARTVRCPIHHNPVIRKAV